MIRWRRFAPTTWLTAAVLVLLPVLALLQFRWLTQIGAETRSQMRAVAESAASALAMDLAFEVSRAWRERVAAAQEPVVDSVVPDPAPSSAPPLILDALVVDRAPARDATGVRLRRWDFEAHTCEAAEWPSGYEALRAEARALAADNDREAHHLAESIERSATVLGVVATELPGGAGRRTAVRPPCADLGPGLVVFRLDLDLLRRTLLPELVRRHLGTLQRDDFRFAIVSGAGWRDVIYASPETDVARVAARPDVAVPLVLARGDRPGRGPRAPGGGEPAAAAPGMQVGRGRPPILHGDRREGWVLLAQHRAGSLDAAVTRLRARNLLISFGILLVLAAAVATIGVNARKAERLGRQQVEFVAAVSHEMRTPVSAIDVAARNLEDGLIADPARVRRYGAVIRSEARRLGETVERVLQFAALDAGRAVGVLADLELRPIVEGVVARARTEHPEASIEIEVEREGGRVRADAALLRSCLQNLVGNAVKYGGKPPRVSVRVEGGDGPAGESRVTVRDRGPGIDPADLPFIFEPFYRGKLATERRIPGSGLGLHIVKRSIEAMGGRVGVDSAPGAGTSVTLHILPALERSDNDAEPSTRPAGRG